MRAKLPHTEGLVDRDGVKLHFEVYGEGSHAIVFVPAWSIVHSRIYKAQLPYFSDHFRTIAYDPRGNGRSDQPLFASAYSFDELADDVLFLVEGKTAWSGAVKALTHGTGERTLERAVARLLGGGVRLAVA